jgi:hypothetical protein
MWCNLLTLKDAVRRLRVILRTVRRRDKRGAGELTGRHEAVRALLDMRARWRESGLTVAEIRAEERGELERRAGFSVRWIGEFE